MEKKEKDFFKEICGFLVEKEYTFYYEPLRWSIDITENGFDINDLKTIELFLYKFNNSSKDNLFYVDIYQGIVKIRLQDD